MFVSFRFVSLTPRVSGKLAESIRSITHFLLGFFVLFVTLVGFLRDSSTPRPPPPQCTTNINDKYHATMTVQIDYIGCSSNRSLYVGDRQKTGAVVYCVLIGVQALFHMVSCGDAMVCRIRCALSCVF